MQEMEKKYAVHQRDARAYDTERLREEFVSEGILREGKLHLIYTHYDRFIYGGAMPTASPVVLDNYDDLKADYFLQRREMGVLHLGGGKGSVQVDGEEYLMKPHDMLYIGKGKKDIRFSSAEASDPAKYYINSAPAHKGYPTVKNSRDEANLVELGSQQFANRRNLYQYIHDDGIQSCQLVMGFTELLEGNVWNTFPPHTHARRMEVYFYFDLPDDQLVLHLMGEPGQTRHLALRNGDAVVSPPWSIHAGAGTSAYKFVWGMAGENKAFTDMDAVDLKDFR